MKIKPLTLLFVSQLIPCLLAKASWVAPRSLTDASSLECGQQGSFSIATDSLEFGTILSRFASNYTANCGNEVTVQTTDTIPPLCGSQTTTVSFSRVRRDEAEAVRDDYIYQCQSDENKNFTRFEIAIEGYVFITSSRLSNSARECIELLGGLTRDQIRWIFSSYSDEELIATGWNQSSLTFSDNDPTTHFWSELNPACLPREILIAGPDPSLPSYPFFVDAILPDASNGETIAVQRQTGYTSGNTDAQVARFVLRNLPSIGFVGYNYWAANSLRYYSVPIQSSTNRFISPSISSIQDGSYDVLSRPLYINIPSSAIPLVSHLVAYILSDSGRQERDNSFQHSFIDISTDERIFFLSILNAPGGVRNMDEIECVDPDTLLEERDNNENDEEQSISIAGSPTLFSMTNLLGRVYTAACAKAVAVERGGSSSSAIRRVCGNEDLNESPINIGTVSRPWKGKVEGHSFDGGFTYGCLSGDISRRVFSVNIAIDGIVLATAINGAARSCIETLGGLTLDQLRWIYSSLSFDQLVQSGWDPESLPNSDGDDKSHLWSELDASCSRTEILIAGAAPESQVFDKFADLIFLNRSDGEVFDLNRPRFFSYYNSTNDADVAEYIDTFRGGLAFFNFTYFDENLQTFKPVAIRNPVLGVFVEPSVATLDNGAYEPLSSRLTLNTREGSLDRVMGFLRFGLSDRAKIIVQNAGFLPLGTENRNEMLDRLGRVNEPRMIEPPPAPLFCFSGQNLVETKDRGLVKLRNVKIGDLVRTGAAPKSSFEPIYSFAHFDGSSGGRFLEFHVDTLSHALQISHNHLILVVSNKDVKDYNKNGEMIPASNVRVGQKVLLVNGQAARVNRIVETLQVGIYAPLTPSGRIVVSGVLASTYVTLQENQDSLSLGGFRRLFSMHWLSHIYLSPHRLFCKWYPQDCASEEYIDGISKFMTWPLSMARWMLRQGHVLQLFIFVPSFIVVLCIRAVEATGESVLFFATVFAVLLYGCFTLKGIIFASN